MLSFNFLSVNCVFSPSTATQWRNPKHKRYSFPKNHRKLKRTFIIQFSEIKLSFAAPSYSWVCFFTFRHQSKLAMLLKWCPMAMFMFSLSILEKHMFLIQPHWNLKYPQQMKYHAKALNVHLHINLLVRCKVVFSSTWLMLDCFASCWKYTTTSYSVFILIKM